MADVLDRIVHTREAAHEAASLAYAVARAALDNGKPARIVAGEHEEDRTVQQNRYYWGLCLREISEQATVGGQRYAVDAWHELFKRQFLGYEVVKVRVAGRKKPTVIRRLRSTKKLKVRAFGRYLDELQAFAATDLGVQFSVARWQDYAG
jgi:hypothetical protein